MDASWISEFDWIISSFFYCQILAGVYVRMLVYRSERRCWETSNNWHEGATRFEGRRHANSFHNCKSQLLLIELISHCITKMKPNFISSEIKQTKSLDWTKPLTRYITALYGSADEFATPINTLTRLRNDLASVIATHSTDEKSKELYYKYFGQLELLDLRLPVNDTGVYAKFTWYDAYDSTQHHSQHSLAFEKASVLFNLASVLSTLSVEAFELNDDYKQAIKYMQYAAGVYQFIHDNFLNAPSIDLNNKTIAFLNKLMLAQAQELFLLNLINAENDKYSLVARIASSTASFYENTNELYLDDLEFGEEYKWLSIIRFKFQFYQSLSYYYQAKALEANKIGESIGYLNLALDGLQHCRKFENSTEIEFKHYISLIEDQIKISIKENDFIYHHSIPSNETLNKIKPLDSVKPIAINDHTGITDIIGSDLFEKIIPLSVHEKLSLYSESKAQILREQLEKNDINDKEYESFIEDNNIYKIFGLFKNFVRGKIIDDELIKMGKLVQGSRFNNAKRNKEIVDSLKSSISSKLAKIQQLINSAPSINVSEFNQEVIEIKNSLVEAAKIDQKISINEQELQMFSSEESLRSNFSNSGTPGDSLLDMDDSSNAENQKAIEKIDSLLRELNNLKSEKGHILTDLKEKIHNDDISQILVLNSKSTDCESQEAIFKQELLKFDSLINRFDEILYNSSKTIKALDKEIEKLFQVSKFSEIFNKFMNVIGFEQIFKNFEDNFDKSLGFYTHLNDQVLNDLENNINFQLRHSRTSNISADDALVERFRTLSTTSTQSNVPPPQPSYNIRNPSIVSNSSEKSWSGLSTNSPSLPPKKPSFSQVPPVQSQYSSSYQQQQQEPQHYQILPTPTAQLPKQGSASAPQAPPKPQQYQPQQYQGYIPQPSQPPQTPTPTYPNYMPHPQSQPQAQPPQSYNHPQNQYHSQPVAQPQPLPSPTAPQNPSHHHQQQQKPSNATQAFYNTPPVFDNSMYSSSFSPIQPTSQKQEGQRQRQVDSFTKPYDPNSPYD